MSSVRFLVAMLCLSLAIGSVAAQEPAMLAMPIAVIDAPSNLGLRAPAPGVEPGVRRLPQALRAQGIVERLRARDAGSVPAPAYSFDPDPAVGFRNGSGLARYSAALGERIGERLDRGEFVVVLGGDCSVLLGAGVALRARGRYALAFVDGHDDYSYARDRERYAGIYTAAGVDLGLATGHGPQALIAIGGKAPYFDERDVAHLGLVREPGDREYAAVETFEASAILRVDRAAIRHDGADATVAKALARVARGPREGFWIHLDTDVLHQRVMPAVDSPNPDGLSFTELRALLTGLLRSPQARGLEVTILDPDLDPQGRHAAALVDTLVAAFVDSGRVPSR